MTERLRAYIRTQHELGRRDFLKGLAAIGAAAAMPPTAGTAGARRPSFTRDPFQLGVASGDPDSQGVALWTRLAPEPLQGGGMSADPVEVRWEVSEDEGMRRIVRSGKSTATADWAHSVHVEVDGLKPDRWYWYRFHAGDAVSPVGRTRTMPPEDALPERLRFAFASCQHYETGLFTAYEHMAKEELDLVVHLGDYIYEAAGSAGKVRRHAGPKLTQLDHYRTRYAQYKSDPALRGMHAAAPWIVTWDDHEFANNCAGFISELGSDDPAEYRQRRAHAYQAYWEHMPLRRRSIPRGPFLKLYRRLPFGRLAEFMVMDTRQYRTDQPNGDGLKPSSPEQTDPRGTLMGTEQREWLFDRLGSSRGAWNILAQQVMMARVDRKEGPEEGFSMDQWPGYEHERRMLLRFMKERKVANPVVLTGDIHTHWANELGGDLDGAGGMPSAVELVGTSISSGGDGSPRPAYLEQLKRENPIVKYHSAQRGYVRCDVTRAAWRADFRVMDQVTRPGGGIRTGASFLVEAGRPRLEQI